MFTDNEQITYNQNEEMQKPRRGRPKIKSSEQALKCKIKLLLQKIRRQNQKINNLSQLLHLQQKKSNKEICRKKTQ